MAYVEARARERSPPQTTFDGALLYSSDRTHQTPWFRNTIPSRDGFMHARTHIHLNSTTFCLSAVCCFNSFKNFTFSYAVGSSLLINQFLFLYSSGFVCFVSLILFAIFVFIGFYFSYTSNTLIYFHYQSGSIDQCFNLSRFVLLCFFDFSLSFPTGEMGLQMFV